MIPECGFHTRINAKTVARETLSSYLLDIVLDILDVVYISGTIAASTTLFYRQLHTLNKPCQVLLMWFVKHQSEFREAFKAFHHMNSDFPNISLLGCQLISMILHDSLCLMPEQLSENAPELFL